MKTCLIPLLLFAALFAGYHRVAMSLPDTIIDGKAGRIGVAAFATVFVAIGIMLAINWVRVIGERRVLRSGLNGRFPKGGDRVAVAGIARALGEPMLSPLSSTPCIICKYEVYEETESRGNDSFATSKNTIYEGRALCPSYLETPTGDVRILGFPSEISIGEETISPVVAAPIFEEYLRANPPVDIKIYNPVTAFKHLMEVFNDDDGELRKDFRLHGGKSEGSLYYTETLIRPEDRVCFTGQFSANPAGIVPNTKKHIWISAFSGGLEEAMTATTKRFWGFMIAAPLLIALPNCLLYFWSTR